MTTTSVQSISHNLAPPTPRPSESYISERPRHHTAALSIRDISLPSTAVLISLFFSASLAHGQSHIHSPLSRSYIFRYRTPLEPSSKTGSTCLGFIYIIYICLCVWILPPPTDPPMHCHHTVSPKRQLEP